MDVAKAQSLWEPEPGWLNTASYGLPPTPAWDELQAALRTWRHGSRSRNAGRCPRRGARRRVHVQPGVRAATRAGSLRASFHLYTTADDVDAALEALVG